MGKRLPLAVRLAQAVPFGRVPAACGSFPRPPNRL